MRLNLVQCLWLAGAVALAVGLALDIANVVNPANLVWATAAGLLLLTIRVMPAARNGRKRRRNG